MPMTHSSQIVLWLMDMNEVPSMTTSVVSGFAMPADIAVALAVALAVAVAAATTW